jgi:putative membrane protein insertion efficiency factor
MIRRFLLKLLSFYQGVLTRLTPGSCRYYPSCSEYARWQFEKNNLLLAFIYSLLRILRCNQLFQGGIDYPVVNKLNCKIKKDRIPDIKYWYVPKGNGRYYLIKNFSKGKPC